MSISNYSPPQSTISQYLQITVPGATDRRNALVLGPQYEIRRYAKGTTPASLGQPYAITGLKFLFPEFEDDGKLDPLYTKLFADGLRLKVASISGAATAHFSPTSLAEPEKISLFTDAGNTTYGAVGGPALLSAFHGRSMKVGDTVLLTGNSKSVLRKVVAVLGTPFESSHDDESTSVVGNPVDNAADALALVSATGGLTVAIASGTFQDSRRPMYNGYLGDRLTLTPTVAGVPGVAKFRVTSSSGLYDFVSATTDQAGAFLLTTAVGGLQIKVVGAAVTLTDRVVLDIRAAYDKLEGLVDGVFTGAKDTTYVVRVTKGGTLGTAEVLVSDTAGIEVARNVVVGLTGLVALGSNGLSLTLDDPQQKPQGVFLVGDAYTVSAVAAGRSTVNYSTLLLDGPAYDPSTFSGVTDPASIALAADIQVSYTGEIGAKQAGDFIKNFTTGALATDGIDVRANLALEVDGLDAAYAWAPAVDGSGKLYVTARALVPPALGESYFSVTSVAEIFKLLGPVDPDNDLAYAVHQALTAAQGKKTYFVRVASDDDAGYVEATGRVSNSDTFYALTTTADAKISRSVLQSHVVSMSAPKKKKWRMAILPIASPGVYGVQTSGHTCTVSSYEGGNRRLRDESGVFTALNLKAGDLIRLNYSVNGWGDEIYETYAIKTVVSDQELILATSLPSPTSVDTRYEVWKADTADNTVSYLVAQAQAASERRVTLVWVDNPLRIDSSGGYVAQRQSAPAAEMAGLRAYSLPHQGLTRAAISSVASAPSMYTRFTEDQLNTIAGAGICIIMQDEPDSTVYVRHQLTTDTNNGALYYEQSVTSNVDDLSYTFKTPLDSYVGKWNATPTTLALIRNKANKLLLDKSLTVLAENLGPQIAGFDDTKGTPNTVLLVFNPTNKDRLIMKVRYQIPLPLNGVDLYQEGVEIDLATGEVVAV